LDNAPTIGFAARVAPASGRVAAGCWEDVEIFQWDGNTLEKVGYKNTGGRVMAVGAVDDIIYSAEWRYLQVLEYGAIALPDADFSSRELNFPATEAGNSVILPLTIYSNGGTTLEFTSSYSSNVEFVLEGDLIPVLAGDSLEFTVRYNASAGSASGELILLTNDHDEEEVRVQLNGNHNGVNVNEPAPLFNLPIVTNGSGEFNLAEHAGEIIVLAFFATW
jgi:hypothetical protein